MRHWRINCRIGKGAGFFSLTLLLSVMSFGAFAGEMEDKEMGERRLSPVAMSIFSEPASPATLAGKANRGDSHAALVLGYMYRLGHKVKKDPIRAVSWFRKSADRENAEGQLQMARNAGVEINLVPIGREAFVFFVNVQNPVSGLSINDIRRIYSGEVTNWREFGGNHSKIRAFQRTENSGSQTALVQFMDDTPLMTPPTEDVAGGMGGIISRVSSYKNYDNAIGYSFLFFATEMVNENKIKLLELNGIAPTRENVANKTYPYAAEFYAVTAGTDNPNVGAFIEWILSEQGQYLIEKTGSTPLR
jgi:hypothetical protein